MQLFYFELEVEGKLYDTKIVSAENSWYAWVKFRDMVAGTWDAEMTEMNLDKWRLVGKADAQSTVFTGYHACPSGILSDKVEA